MVSVHGCPLVTPGMRSAGGMNVYLRRVTPMLARLGLHVDIYTRNHHLGGPEVLDLGTNARVIHLPAGAPRLRKLELLPYLDEYRERLLSTIEAEGEGYDVVHSHYWLSGDAGDALASHLGVPHVTSFHTLAAVKERASGEFEHEERKAVESRMAFGASMVLAFTEDEARELGELFDVPRHRVAVVPPGVDADLFAPRDRREARQRVGLGTDERVILFVGRPEPFKGPDVLVRALPHLSGFGPVRLVMVGGSSEEHDASWLMDLAASEGVGDMVRWQQAIPQQDLPDFYAAADVVAVPSFHETFGLAALEAMACGVPVIAADVGGLRSLVLNRETGCLVASHEPEDFAAHLRALLVDPSLREEMGRAARRWALRFTWDQTANSAFAAYGAAVTAAPR